MGLAHIGSAARLVGFDLRPGERREQERGENGDNRDHHQELNQRKAANLFQPKNGS